MEASVRAMMWKEVHELREIARTYLETPFAEAGIRPLALGLLRTSYVLETLLAEHGPEIDVLGRRVVRDAEGKVAERVEP